MGALAEWWSRLTGPRLPRLDPDAFTEAMARRIAEALPGADVRVLSRFSLELDRDGGRQAVFLDNPWHFAGAARSEGEREQVMAGFVASVVDVPAADRAGADDVVPLLKPPGWFAALPQRDDGSRPEHLVEPLCDGLAIVYALDTPHNIAYVERAWFAQRGISPDGLRARAIANLRGKLPGIEVQRGGGLNLVVAGGYHEASVLLFDDFWARETPRLKGEPVIAMPARDVLLFADARDPRALLELGEHARGIHAEAAYALSPDLFTRSTDGRVQPFSG